MTWQVMKRKKPNLELPQPQLPEYYGKAKETIDLYCEAVQILHPHLDDPMEHEVVEEALVSASSGREHGRYKMLNAVVPPTITLTQLKATRTADHPLSRLVLSLLDPPSPSILISRRPTSPFTGIISQSMMHGASRKSPTIRTNPERQMR